jgi:hypothetical protein
MSNLEPADNHDTAERSIRFLVEEIDRYLAEFAGPGIAEVRKGIADARGQAFVLPTVCLRPNTVVSDHLETALSLLAKTHPSLASAIAAAAPMLPWGTYDAYSPDEIGVDFADNHAFASIIGETAALPSADYYMGLFVITPHFVYRDHRHPAPELYAPLTGPHGWRFEPDAALAVQPAHQPIWNEPNRPHLIKVGAAPFLCIYAWTRDVSEPAQVLPANDWAQLEALRLVAG